MNCTLFNPLNFVPRLPLTCPLRAHDIFFAFQLLSIIHDFGLTKLTPSLSHYVDRWSQFLA